jgi:tRNA-specific 2-thiouridylase
MKVIVGMSGGVDSSVAAYLLKMQGFDVYGVYFKMLEGKERDIKSAEQVARFLNIPFAVVDVEKEFFDEVIKDFLNRYKQGFTPNPCVVCNEKIKFGVSFKKAQLVFGASLIASGHYAIVEKTGGTLPGSAAGHGDVSRKINEYGGMERAYGLSKPAVHLRKGIDRRKDQSYMLWKLTREELLSSIFPLGKLTKGEVYKIAEKSNIPFIKKESQDVCFINGKLNAFLREHFREKKGDIIFHGKVIGTHRGAFFYTVGQRSGLGISYKKPLYVVRVDTQTNTVFVGKREECFFKYAELVETNFIESWSGEPIKLTGKVRYQSPEKPCTLKRENGKIVVEFEEKQFAIARGQSLVLYRGDYVFGGGIINTAY